MDTVIKPKFNIEDWWNRYEFQSRGSSHNHGFVWVKEGMSPQIDVNDEASRREFAEYWSPHSSGCLPINVDRSQEQRTPMSLPPELDENTIRQLDMLVALLQRHVCTDTYCLRIPKGAKSDAPKECRFWSPWALRLFAVVDKSRNPKHWMFQPIRNDDRTNAYNRLITMVWKANTDFTPVSGSEAMASYLSKYVTKWEKESTTYLQLVRDILPHLNSAKPLLSLVAKTMNKLHGERDWSSQEIFHILMDISFQSGSREVLSLDCRPNQRTQPIELENGEVTANGTTRLQKYIARPADHPDIENVTFFQFLTLYEYKKYTLRPRAKPRLINYFPTYDPDKDSDKEDYTRVKMMLHHPFRDVEDLLVTDDNQGVFNNWHTAFQNCLTHHTHADLIDGMRKVPIIDDDDFETPADEAPENELDWAEFARQRPGQAGQLEDADALGNREIDRAFDWTSIEKHPDATPFWLQEVKAANPMSLDVDYESQSTVEKLTLKQRQAYDIAMDQVALRVHNEAHNMPPPKPLRMHLDGKAGTGKSFYIHLVSAHLQQKYSNNVVVRAAPTGVAAHGIMGRTIHSLFRLPTSTDKFQPLARNTLASLQASLRGLMVLIIDEKSMMSLMLLSFLDQRLRQIFTARQNDEFGGVDIILCGDFFQLPPVASNALYNNLPLKNTYDVSGQTLYQLFDQTIELNLIMRQQGNDPESEAFRAALEGLRNNDVKIDDWKLLTSRVKSTLPADEVAMFDDALRIYGKKVDVNEYNHIKMRDMGVPVKQIKALHSGTGAEAASWDQGANLHRSLPLCFGARVMLTENSWTECGLVNGALGYVRGFQWPEGADIEKTLPTVLIEFDHYDGPVLYEDRRLVAIPPSKREFTLNNIVCTREQLPVTIAWAVTVHKAQGITAEKIVTNIAQKDHVVGLSYVAISRVRTLRGLLFEEPFDFSRFKTKAPSKTETMRLADYAKRLPQHVAVVVPAIDEDLYGA